MTTAPPPIRDEQGQIIGVVLVFRDVSERRLAEQRRNARLAITQILAQQIDIETAATEILSTVCSALQWDAGSFWRLDSDENVVRCREFRQVSPRNLEAFREATLHRTFPPGTSLPGRVWQSRQPLWIPDIVMDPHIARAPQAEEADLHGAFACPVTVGEKFLGAIEFFSQHIQPSDNDLLEMMATIGGQLGQFIERREAEYRLRRSEVELSDFFENANVGLHWVGPDGIFLRVNRAELDLLGYSREEYVGRHIAEFHVDQPVIEDILTRLTRGEALCDYPARMRAKDGSIRDVMVNSSVLFEDGKFIHTRCFTLDVTKAKRAQEDQARLAAIIQSSDDAIIGKDVNGIVTSWNEAAERMFGYSADEMIGQPIAAISPPDRADEMSAILDRIRRDERIEHFDTVRRAKDGRLVPISLSVSPVTDEDGNIIGASKIARDISDRKRAEAELHHEKAQLHATLIGIGDAVIVTDTQGDITLINPVAQSLTAWTEQEAAGRPLDEVFRIVNEQSREPVESPVARVLREKTIVGLANHTVLIAKDGTELPIDDSAAPIHDAEGNLTGVVLVFRDITQRRKAENTLRDSENLKSAILETALDCIITIDQEGEIVEFNPAAERTFGFRKDEVLGRKMAELIVPPALRERHHQGLAHYLATGESQILNRRIEISALHADGTEFPIELAVTAIHQDGPPLFTAHIRSITERKRADERMASVVNHVVDGIISIDERGTVTTFNPAAERIFGYSAAEVIGRNVKLLMPEPYHSEHDGYVANYVRTGEAKIIGIGREVLGRRKDGSTFPLELAISVYHLGKHRHFTGIVRDITDRKRAEEELRHAEERIRSVVNHVIDGIITIDSRGTVESFNPAAEKLFGYARSEVIGRNVKMLMPEPFHGQHDRYIDNYLRTGEAKIIDIGREVIGQRKDGSTFPMELAVSEFHIGPGRYFTGIVRDITERKRLEQELRQRLNELAEADRRKDHFLATLAHELRNPLAPIRTGLELMKMAPHDAAVNAEAQATMDRQVTQMVRLVDDLLDVSRIASGKIRLQKEDVNLADVIHNAAEAVRPHIDEQQQELTVSLPIEPICLNVDPIRLAQAVSNLLNNASKYSDKKGGIWLRAEQRDGEAFISVRDHGIGIDAEQLPRIFEMFSQVTSTLDRSQGGLGIGLSLVKGLIELHGGHVEASSGGAGVGSEFTIRLPANPSITPQSQQTTDEEKSSTFARRRILVVDDNRDAADVLAKTLEFMGHDAHTAYDGLEAVHAAESLRPEVILLDIGLPKMNGYEAARHIREQEWGKQMLLIALSGWGQDEDKRRAIEAGFDHHLTKPVESVLLQTVLASTAH